jgi:hypothetical protein
MTDRYPPFRLDQRIDIERSAQPPEPTVASQ